MNTLQLIIVWWASLVVGGILVAKAAANSSSNYLIATVALIAAVAVYSLQPHPAANKRRVLYAVLGPLVASVLVWAIGVAVEVHAWRRCQERQDVAVREVKGKLKIDVRIDILGDPSRTPASTPASREPIKRDGHIIIRVDRRGHTLDEHGNPVGVHLIGNVTNGSSYELDGGFDLQVLPPDEASTNPLRTVSLKVHLRPGEVKQLEEELVLSREETRSLADDSPAWRFRVTRVWGVADVCR